MQGDNVRVNGNVLSWGSLTCKVDGDPIKGFTSITYDEKRTREKVYGMGAHQAPIGRTRGKYEPGVVKLKGKKSSCQALREALAAKSGTASYGDAEFEITLQGVESDESPITIEATRCVYVGLSSGNEEGPGKLEEEIEIDVMGFRHNGLTLWDSTTDGSPI